jgi:hypothetical protein
MAELISGHRGVQFVNRNWLAGFLGYHWLTGFLGRHWLARFLSRDRVTGQFAGQCRPHRQELLTHRSHVVQAALIHPASLPRQLRTHLRDSAGIWRMGRSSALAGEFSFPFQVLHSLPGTPNQGCR